MDVIAVQLLLPLAFLAFWPAHSRTGFVLQGAGTGLLLLALALVTQWLLLPWWAPWLYLVLWLIGVMALVLRGHPGRPLWPEGRQWSALLLGLALAGAGGWAGGVAMLGRSAPPVEAVAIPNPLGPGTYLVAHGGSRQLVNGHMKTLDQTVPRYAGWRGQSYAVDLAAINRLGLRADGWRPADPARYFMFGRPVYAPCGGTVLAAEDQVRDMRVPTPDDANTLGNHVLLQCDHVVLLLAHLRNARVAVTKGQSVNKGAFLGEVGNSGNSTEPHLHLHAQRPAPAGEPPISGEPLSLRIDGHFPVRNDRLRGRQW